MISKAAKERKMREKIEAEMNEKSILNHIPIDPKIAIGGSILIGSFILYRWLSKSEKTVEEPVKKKVEVRERIVKISPPEKKFETLG